MPPHFGWHFDNGEREPTAMVITETPIDEMSYFELHHRQFDHKSTEFCLLSGSDSKAVSITYLISLLFDKPYGRVPQEIYLAEFKK